MSSRRVGWVLVWLGSLALRTSADGVAVVGASPSVAGTGAVAGPGQGITVGIPAVVSPGWGLRGYPFSYDPAYPWGWGPPRTTVIIVNPTVVVPMPGVGPVGPVRNLPGPPVAFPRPAQNDLEPRAGLPATRRRGEPGRAERLMTLGDRYFRARNLRRAIDRYEQAAAADPDSAGPRIRLAQVAFVKDDYAEAANLIREALTSEPGWLATARDIQSIYGDPADFRAPIGRLEARLQAEPGDRDAWLVLGTQLYLSGQPNRAADIFLRLSDRAGDPTVAALLEATRPVRRAVR